MAHFSRRSVFQTSVTAAVKPLRLNVSLVTVPRSDCAVITAFAPRFMATTILASSLGLGGQAHSPSTEKLKIGAVDVQSDRAIFCERVTTGEGHLPFHLISGAVKYKQKDLAAAHRDDLAASWY